MAFAIYKRDQGKYTRLGTGSILVILIGLGCFQLYRMLEGTDAGLWVRTMVPAGIFVVVRRHELLVSKPSDGGRFYDFCRRRNEKGKLVEPEGNSGFDICCDFGGGYHIGTYLELRT